jgi:glycosyltransferase involved in cell wall biosynthesis
VNIMCLHPFLSMRAVKEMSAVKESGHKVILAYQGAGSSTHADKGDFWDKIIEIPCSKIKGIFQLRLLFPRLYKKFLNKIIKEEKIDLIHVFSTPDNLAVAAIKYTKIPVIYDIRDLTTGMDNHCLYKTNSSFLNKLQEKIYFPIQRRFEEFACNNSQGVVCVSSKMAYYVITKYNLPKEKVIHLESYSSIKNIPKIQKRKLSQDGGIHLVYIGNILFNTYEKSLLTFKQITENKINLHIYPTGDKKAISELKENFRNNRFMHFHKSMKQKLLLGELSRYDYGLVLYTPDVDKLNRRLTISNKLFEYLACGIPVAATNMGATRELIRKNNAGIVFSNIPELIHKVKESSAGFSINQNEFVMEKHIQRLIRLYEKCIID